MGSGSASSFVWIGPAHIIENIMRTNDLFQNILVVCFSSFEILDNPQIDRDTLTITQGQLNMGIAF
jgi:hypothetical protein